MTILAKHKKKKHSAGQAGSENTGEHANDHPAKKSHTHTVHRSEIKRSTNPWIWVGAAVILILAVYAIYNMGSDDKSKDSSDNMISADAVNLDLYVMSQCPYGTQVEDSIAPVLKKLGGNVNLNLNYIANDNGDGSFTSLHGPNEVQGDIVQLCAMKYNPDTYMDMIICQNKDAGSIPGNWESCATDNGLDVDKIKACYEGEEGKDLLSASISSSEHVGATGSPTIYIGNDSYSGGRGENDFMRAICNAYTGEKPDACADIPAPAEVDIIVINDKRCKECDMTQLIGQLKGVFPGLKAISYDYSQPEAKTLMAKSGIQLLPAVLFDDSVQKDENYANVEQYLVPAGDYTSLRIGADFDPSAEICDNGIDDTGNGLVDCQDETCKGTIVCRDEIKDDLQVFIMSDCPYGKQAIIALKDVIANFGSALKYDVHYIASESGDSFSSLHGTYEADEDIVQLCTKQHSPDVWFEYVYCRSEEGIKGNDWKNCAEQTGVDISAVESCVNGTEGAELLRQDIKIAQGLSISASPTWLANNKYIFSGIAAEAIKSSFCKYNPALSGCENTLAADSGSVPAGACG